MIKLLQLVESQQKFAGEEVGQKPGDQVRGTDKAKTGGKDHPFKGRLVGEDTALEDVLTKKYRDFKELQAKEKEKSQDKEEVEEGALSDFYQSKDSSVKSDVLRKRSEPWEEKVRADMAAGKDASWFLDRNQGAGQKWTIGTPVWSQVTKYQQERNKLGNRFKRMVGMEDVTEVRRRNPLSSKFASIAARKHREADAAKRSETESKDFDRSSGSPYDRGGADAWYHRSARPHKLVKGQEVKLTDPEEIAQYHQGFEDEGVTSKYHGKQYDEADVNYTVNETGDSSAAVAQAITRRILNQRSDLLNKYGPSKVVDAIDDVASFVGDVEEIGSSDISIWVKQVERALSSNNEVNEATNPMDKIVVDVPLMLRIMEYAREDAKDDMDLHDVATRLVKLSSSGNTLGMKDYDAIMGQQDQIEELAPGPATAPVTAPAAGNPAAKPATSITANAAPTSGSISPDEQKALDQIKKTPAMQQQFDKLMTQATPGAANKPMELDPEQQGALEKIKANAGLKSQYDRLIKQANPQAKV